MLIEYFSRRNREASDSRSYYAISSEGISNNKSSNKARNKANKSSNKSKKRKKNQRSDPNQEEPLLSEEENVRMEDGVAFIKVKEKKKKAKVAKAKKEKKK